MHTDRDLRSELITRDELIHHITAAVFQMEYVPARDHGEEIYRAGFRAALGTLALAYNLNVPTLRGADAQARQRTHTPTRHNMRL